MDLCVASRPKSVIFISMRSSTPSGLCLTSHEKRRLEREGVVSIGVVLDISRKATAVKGRGSINS